MTPKLQDSHLPPDRQTNVWQLGTPSDQLPYGGVALGVMFS